MKKILSALITSLMFLSLIGCNAVTSNEITLSIGTHSSVDFTTTDTLPQRTDFAVYTYEEYSFDNNIYFTKVNKGTLMNCIKSFENRVNALKSEEPTDDIAMRYDFDKSIISDDDYMYIKDASDDYKNICLYYFDNSCSSLFYFNIQT
ncbi:MAG: hypothetical protein IJM97_08575 [Clostridia bacterium]|nr:hypothetical protein [Clostridia bacterium]MBQ6708987.1 hypothetical protein [Clostridia bacterium]